MRQRPSAPSEESTLSEAPARFQSNSLFEKWFLDVFAFLLILMMLSIVLQVALSYFDINPVITFEEDYFLIGDSVTLNTLLDGQWHMLVLVALPPAGLVLLRGGHVRVDFIYAKLSRRRQALVDLFGHAVFAIPFFYYLIPAAVSFAQSAYRNGQGSSNGGLNDLFLIKAVLPIGLSLMAIAVAIDMVLLVRRLARK